MSQFEFKIVEHGVQPDARVCEVRLNGVFIAALYINISTGGGAIATFMSRHITDVNLQNTKDNVIHVMMSLDVEVKRNHEHDRSLS